MSDRLLDTSVVIDHLRGRRKQATAFIQSLSVRPGVSVVTVTEIFSGLRSQKEEAAARAIFSECRVFSISGPIAEQSGTLLRHFGASHSLDVPDALIAATAEHHGIDLATLKVKHFPMIKGLKAAH